MQTSVMGLRHVGAEHHFFLTSLEFNLLAEAIGKQCDIFT